MLHQKITPKVKMDRSSILKSRFLCLLLVGASVLAFRASATEIFTYDNLVQATYSDNSGGVTLTLTALAGGDGLNALYFNLNPSLSASSLAFNETASSGTFSDYSVATGGDAFKVDGGGKYDIKFAFQDQTINAGDSITFALTGIAGLSSGDFYYLSTACAGGIGSTYSSAILTDANGNPMTVLDDVKTVPDNSATIILLGTALLGLEAFTLRRKISKIFQTQRS